jgi:hypothetical protein
MMAEVLREREKTTQAATSIPSGMISPIKYQIKGGSAMAVDGSYNITVHTRIGDQKRKVTFKTEGNVLNGTSEVPMVGVAAFTGKVNGNVVEWTENVNTPKGLLKVDFKGTADGDKISGQAVSEFGPSPFDGTRV